MSRPRGDITVRYECPACSAVFSVTATPVIPAQIYGPPENCHPEEGGEIEPDECNTCGLGIDPWDVSDLIPERTEREYEREDRE